MKRTLFLFFALMGALASMAQLPGPVMAVSESAATLPKAAKSFLNQFYKGLPVLKCEFEPGQGGGYEVELQGGTEIEFNAAGAVQEISAPDDCILPAKVSRKLLPERAYNFLVTNSLSQFIESIEFEPNGTIEVDFTVTAPDKIVFDRKGAFLKLLRD